MPEKFRTLLKITVNTVNHGRKNIIWTEPSPIIGEGDKPTKRKRVG